MHAKDDHPQRMTSCNSGLSDKSREAPATQPGGALAQSQSRQALGKPSQGMQKVLKLYAPRGAYDRLCQKYSVAHQKLRHPQKLQTESEHGGDAYVSLPTTNSFERSTEVESRTHQIQAVTRNSLELSAHALEAKQYETGQVQR